MIAVKTETINGEEKTIYLVDDAEVSVDVYTAALEKARAEVVVRREQSREQGKKLLAAVAEKTNNKRAEVAAKLGITVDDLLALR